MSENYIYTKDYILQYINYIKHYKLKSEYDYKNKIILGYEDFFNKKKKILEGGNLKNAAEKMKKINEMFEKFSEISGNSEELKKKYSKFQEHVDNISKEIEKIDFKGLNIDKIKDDDLKKIISSFNEENNISEHIQDIAYFKKKEIEFFDKTGENSIEKILDKLKLTFKNLNEKKIKEDDIKKITDEFTSYVKKLDENLDKINSEIDTLKKEDLEFKNYLKFNSGENKIKLVRDDDKVNPVINMTKVITNGFLDFDVKIEAMKTSAEEIKKLSENRIIRQKGGENISPNNATKFIDYLNMIQKKIDLFNDKTEEYKKILTQVNSNNKYKTGYFLFMVALSVDKIKRASTYVIFEYIGRNMINFYLKIVNDIILNEEKNLNPIKVENFNYTRDYVVLHKLKNFLLEIQKYIVSEEKKLNDKTKNEIKKKINLFVDIKECSENAQNMFVLLNNYKSVLEEYKISALNKVSIYSRINDISSNPIELEKKFFMSSFDKSQLPNQTKNNEESPYDMFVYSNTKACNNLICIKDKKEGSKQCDIDGEFMKYKFSEVFDSTIYSNNNDLSQYMSLNTLLSNKSDSTEKKNGIVLMTYGYSGTGKTYTLFGSSNENNKTTGILQSTLKTINGLLSVRFRLYEVYGFGLPYPHFWKNKKVTEFPHDVIQYKIEKKNNELSFSDINIFSGEEFSSFVKDYNLNKNSTTYLKIDGNEIKQYFDNFDNLVNKVEKFRENDISDELKSASDKLPQYKKRRVRDTNNNDVSSRSILIYDFMIEMSNGTFVPFLLIDLPGREEIVQTFIDPYFNNNLIKDLYFKGYAALKDRGNATDDFMRAKMIFLMMALNPMGIALYCYDDILNFFTKKIEKEDCEFFGAKNEDKAEEERKKILNTKLMIEYGYNPLELDEKKSFVFSSNKKKILGVNGQKGFIFSEEIINYKGGQLEVIIEPIKNYIIFKKIPDNNVKGYSEEKQLRALVCTHLINRLIMMDKLEIIYNIYKIISEKYLNKYLLKGLESIKDADDYCKKLVESNFKAVHLEKKLISIDKSKKTMSEKSEAKKELLKSIIQNDYYLSPFEGIYINENISGIIKYLSTHEALIPDKIKRIEQEKKLEETSRQDLNLDFQKQQKKMRLWLYDNIEGITLKQTPMNEYKYADIAYFFYMKDELSEYSDWFDAKPLEKSENVAKLRNKKKTEEVNIAAKKIIPKQIFFSANDIQTEYDKVAKSYESSKIFNFENPAIKQIIEPYIMDITDYKILYLFGNYSDDNMRNMKCKNQFGLLEKTKDFISNIVGE